MSEKPIVVALWIDDADYIDDHSEDALRYMLAAFDRLGIRVTFKIAGEKARVLKQHHCDDIIGAMKLHDMCYHTEYHTLHPTVLEYTEALDFTGGAAEFEKREIGGLHDVREIFGRPIIGYGHPGEAWSPDVCPVLMKYGADVCLDDHFILNVEGQPFEYGGILNFNAIRRIVRYDYHDVSGLDAANAAFDRLAAMECGRKYPERYALFSVFYHPGEFYMAEYMSDMYNFREGKNIPFDAEGNFTGWILPPVISMEEAHRYIDLVAAYLSHMQKRGARFVTASELRHMMYRRTEEVSRDDVKALAAAWADEEIEFFDIGGEYVSASEGFVLLMQYLSGKPLSPYLVYGPGKRETSVIRHEVTRDAVLAAMADFDAVYGFPMLKSAYLIGENLLTPTDLCATAALMIKNVKEQCMPVSGAKLLSERYVQGTPKWDGRWLFGSPFDVSNTYEKTKLQCWTLKPLRY